MPPQDPFAADKETPQAFAQRYKAAHPETAQMSDDLLIQRLLRDYPKLGDHLIGGTGPMTGTAKISGPPRGPQFGVTPMPSLGETAYGSAKAVTGALPGIGGAIGAGAMLPSGPGAVLGGAAGSAVGTGAEQLLNRAIFPPSKGWKQPTSEENTNEALWNTLLGGLFEIPGAVFRSPAVAAFRKSLEPEAQEILQTSRDFNLGLTPPQVMPTPFGKAAFSQFPRSVSMSRGVMETGDEAIRGQARQAVGDLVESTFGRSAATMSPDVAGQRVKMAIDRIGSPLFKQQFRGLEAKWNLLGQGINTQPGAIGQMQHELRQEILELSRLRQRLSAVPGTPNSILQRLERTQEIYDDILKLPGQSNVVDLNKLRGRLIQETPDLSKPIGNEPVGQAKHFIHELTDIIDESVKGTPARQAWQDYRRFYDWGHDIVNSHQVVDALNQEPEKMASIVGPKDITGAQRMREAILGFAERSGTPQQKRIASNAWNKYRAQWVKTHVLDGDINQLTARLNEIDPKVMRTMVEHDPQGQLLIRNARRLGAAIDMVTRLQGEGGDSMIRYGLYRMFYGSAGLVGAGLGYVGLGHSISGAAAGAVLGEGGALATGRLLAKVLYSPQATERAIKLVTFIARNPVFTSANAMRIMDYYLEGKADLPRRNQAAEPAPPPQTSELRALPGRRKPSAGLDRQGKPISPPLPIEENLQWPPPTEEQPQ